MLKKLRIKFICFNMVIVTAMLMLLFTLSLGITKKNLEAPDLQGIPVNEMNILKNLLWTNLVIGGIFFTVFLLVSILLSRLAVRPVERAWEQQRRFIADASHELKTPLTVILTNADMLNSPGYSEASRQKFSDNILVMSQQMRGLVESMLDLARADNGSMELTPLDLSQITESAILPFEPVYFEKNLTIHSDIENHIAVKGSEMHLQQIIGILLDNAWKYSYSDGEITVSLKKQSRRHCILSVKNPGPALSPADQKNIFKRFYRIDKARTMNCSYGLGLSIADSIVSWHKGKIWCESANGCNTFFVRLPVYQYLAAHTGEA